MKPFSAGGGFATLAAGHAGEESRRPAQPPTQPSHRWILPSPLLPKATAAKNNSTRKKISCWILLLLSPAAVGASLRSPMAMRGRRAAAARTAEQPEQPNSRTARTAEQPNSRTTRTAEQPEQPNSPNSCRRFRPLPFPRPLPSSSPSRSCLS